MRGDRVPAEIVAVIPARGGSKRIPRKNLISLGGVPLVVHTIRHALASTLVDSVYVSTDDTEIAAVSTRAGAHVVLRPTALSTDEADSESALLHVLDARLSEGLPDPELVVFLQPTSPVRRERDIDSAIETLRRLGVASVFSACDDRKLLWRDAPDGPRPLNYDFHNRRREQEMGAQVMENGSIYVVRTPQLRARRNRMVEPMAVYRMDYWASFQIDTPEDIELCEWILGRPTDGRVNPSGAPLTADGRQHGSQRENR
jgi:N-acylneuraminate cytidylyltransferase